MGPRGSSRRRNGPAIDDPVVEGSANADGHAAGLQWLGHGMDALEVEPVAVKVRPLLAPQGLADGQGLAGG